MVENIRILSWGREKNTEKIRYVIENIRILELSE